MRQKIRRLVIYIALFLFPITLNYFSPYVSIDGALIGVISGCVIVFITMFLIGIFLRRAWCGWICPMAGLSELAGTINSKKVNVKRLTIIRYSIFGVWFIALIVAFIVAGGINAIKPTHLTENIVSVDEPIKYIIYYIVIISFFGISVLLGKRGACHTICWMSPFLTAGDFFGRFLKLPQLHIYSKANACIDCGRCEKMCPMSIDVRSQAKTGRILSSNCIVCCECVDNCPKSVLKPRFSRIKT